jgi:hypothetical protein
MKKTRSRKTLDTVPLRSICSIQGWEGDGGGGGVFDKKFQENLFNMDIKCCILKHWPCENIQVPFLIILRSVNTFLWQCPFFESLKIPTQVFTLKYHDVKQFNIQRALYHA